MRASTRFYALTSRPRPEPNASSALHPQRVRNPHPRQTARMHVALPGFCLAWPRFASLCTTHPINALASIGSRAISALRRASATERVRDANGELNVVNAMGERGVLQQVMPCSSAMPCGALWRALRCRGGWCRSSLPSPNSCGLVLSFGFVHRR